MTDSLVVTVAQALAAETSGTLPPSGSSYVVTDTAANIETMTADQIAGLLDIGATAIVSTDTSLLFTVAQGLSLQGPPVTYHGIPVGFGPSIAVSAPRDCSVTVFDTEQAVEALTGFQAAGLRYCGVDAVEVPSLTGIAPYQNPVIDLIVDGSISADQVVDLSQGSGKLILLQPAGDAGIVNFFPSLSEIDLRTVAFDGKGQISLTSGSVLSVTDHGQTYALRLESDEDLSAETFELVDDHHGGTTIRTAGITVTYQFYFSGSGHGYSNLTVGSGGTVGVFGGAYLDGTIVVGGGQLIVEHTGRISDTTVTGGTLADAGSALDTLVAGGGLVKIGSGGSAGTVIVESGGILEVDSGAVASGVTVLSGGELLLSGGAVTDLVVSSGGSEVVNTDVLPGETLKGAIVSSGAMLTVYGGGLAVSTVIRNGGLENLHGSATGTVVSGQSATQYVLSGGHANGTTVKDGGSVEVLSGGVVDGAIVQSGKIVVSGGATSLTRISGSGFEIVEAGGLAENVVVSSGATLEILSGAMVSGATVQKGGEIVVHGGTLSGLTVRGGFVTGDIVGPGVTQSGDVISSGGVQTVLKDGRAVSTTILQNGSQTVSGAAFFAVVSAFGTQAVVNGGYASGCEIAGFAQQEVESGGRAFRTVVDSGGSVVVDNGGITQGVRGTEHVFSGGLVEYTTILIHQELFLEAGARSIGSVVSSGGTLGLVLTSAVNGAVTGRAHLAKGVTVAAGAQISVYVEKGASLSNLALGKGDYLSVDLGGVARNITVGSGGTVLVYSGATASGTKLAGGIETVFSGGHVAGAVTFGAHAKLRVEGAPPAGLTLSGFKATDTLDLAGLHYASGMKLSFLANKTKTGGTLTISSGTHHAGILLFGQYAAAGFKLADDGGGGTSITYAQPPAAHLDLAGAHG